MLSHVNLLLEVPLSLDVTKTGTVGLKFHYEKLGVSWQRRTFSEPTDQSVAGILTMGIWSYRQVVSASSGTDL
jgi:hypothetical protein